MRVDMYTREKFKTFMIVVSLIHYVVQPHMPAALKS